MKPLSLFPCLACLLPLALSLFPALRADELQPLGDEFDDAASFVQWQDLGVVEGWGTPSVQSADIDTSTPGHFRIVPGALTWFSNFRGALFFKEIQGDFVATLHLRILSRHNPADPLEIPNRPFSLSGILVHAPRSITQAAPLPYTTTAVWPPAAFGSDWVSDNENYIFLSYGSAGDPGTRQFEIKATRQSNSLLYYDTTGIDQAQNEVWLQLVRVGDTVVCLRKHSAAGAWLVENRYPNANHPFPEFGDTLQVGITAYTDWPTAAPYFAGGNESMFHFNYAPPMGQPDLISEVDYYRFQRPDAALTESVLQAMPTSYDPATNTTSDPPVDLTASALAAPYLGDHANIPVGRLVAGDMAITEGSGQLTVPVNRLGSTAGIVTCAYTLNSGTATVGEDFTANNGTLTWLDGDGTAKSIAIEIAADGLAEGDESFEILFHQVDGPANFPGGALSHTAHITIHDHPVDQWRLDQFGAEANTPAGQLEADYDGDGMANLLELVLGTDATIPDVDSISGAETNGYLALTFTPSASALHVELRVEACADLTADDWSTLATRDVGSLLWQLNDENAEVSVDAGGEVTVRDVVLQTASARRFMRLVALISL